MHHNFLSIIFLGENAVNVGNILPAQDIVNYELSDAEDEFYQPVPAQDDNGNDGGKRYTLIRILKDITK